MTWRFPTSGTLLLLLIASMASPVSAQVIFGGGGSGGGSGTVTSIATTSPITGGTITTTGTIACATCVTSAAALTLNLPVIGGGGQASAVGTASGNTTEFATVTGALTTGHLATWDASGNLIDGGAVPAGLSGLTTTGVLYATSATAATSDANFEWSSGNQALTILGKAGQTALTLTGPTNTASAPVISTTETWNNAGTTFKHIVHNITNTNSAVGSALEEWQIGGSPEITFRRDHTYQFDAAVTGTGSIKVGNMVLVASANDIGNSSAPPRDIYLTRFIRSPASSDAFLYRSAPKIWFLDSNSVGGSAFLGFGPTTFASLGTPAAGHMTYCSDCDAPAAGAMATCTSAGTKTGAWAFRVNSTPVWGCIGI